MFPIIQFYVFCFFTFLITWHHLVVYFSTFSILSYMQLSGSQLPTSVLNRTYSFNTLLDMVFGTLLIFLSLFSLSLSFSATTLLSYMSPSICYLTSPLFPPRPPSPPPLLLAGTVSRGTLVVLFSSPFPIHPP